MEDNTIKSLSDQVYNELELRRELSRRPSGRVLLISWIDEDELSSEWNKLLDDFSCILRDDYHYTIDKLPLAGSAQRDLELKALDLLRQSETSQQPAIIYYHGDVCTDEGSLSYWTS